MLNYIVTLLLQIWLFLKKHLRGLNCTPCSFLWPNMLFLTYAQTSDSIIPLLTISQYTLLATRFHYCNFCNWHSTTQAVYAVQIRKKVTLHSAAIDVNVRSNERDAHLLLARGCSRVHFHFLTAVLLATDAAVAAELQNIYLITSPPQVTWQSYLPICSMFDSVGLFTRSSNYTSRQVSCEPMRGANYSTRALNCSNIHSSYCGYQRFLHTSAVALMSCAAITAITVRQDCALYIHETAASLTSACCCLVTWSTSNRILK